MDKKEYTEPEMRVVEIETGGRLMEASDPGWYDEPGDDNQF